jgi:ribosome-associated protein
MHLRTSATKQNKKTLSQADKDGIAHSSRLLDITLECLDDAKAEKIVPINIQGKSALADHMVIASGRSSRHVSAICDQLLRQLKDEGLGTSRVEGLASGDWVLIDMGDVIVHVFRPEVRDFYALEKMWTDEDHDQNTGSKASSDTLH